MEPVVVIEDAPVKVEDPGVIVDLDKPKDAPAADPKLEQLRTDLKAEFEKEFQARIKPFINQAEQARRQAEQYRVQLEQTTRKPSPTPEDELDKLVDSGNWKEAVTRLADQRATAIIQQREQQNRLEQDALSRKQLLDTSIAKVTSVYPELHEQTGDPASEISQSFTRIMNQHPDLLSNPHGPELTMYAMEQEMIAAGKTPRSWQTAAKVNGAPASRASTTSLLPSRQALPSNKVVLTREQKEFCDRQGLKYEDYARVARTLESTGGVEA
mgnify:CR=1 FL=1